MSVNIKENGQLVKTAGLNSQTVIIDNLTTHDSTKALSANQGYVLNQNKVDKVTGKGLSTNDYTNEDKAKVTSSDSKITNYEDRGYLGKNEMPSGIEYTDSTHNYFRTSNDVFVKAGTYTASFFNGSSNNSKLLVNKVVGGTETTIANVTVNSNSRGSATVTLTNDVYIRIAGRFDPTSAISDLSVFRDIQLELGSTATIYEPYAKSNIELDSAKIDKTASEIQTSDGQFTTVTGGLMNKCEVDLDPIQDLHGYSKPWTGGSGKNKLPNNATTRTINGITWTVEKDADGNVIGVDANGTATAQSDYYFYGSQTLQPLGQITDGMILSGCPSGGSANSYYIVAGSLSSRYATDSGYGDTLSNVLQDGIRVICRIANGYTANHVKFRPMIRQSGQSATFEPYSNICAISGHTQVQVRNVGKNWLSPTLATTTLNGITCTNNGDGTYTLNGTATADTDFTIQSLILPEPIRGKELKLVGCPVGGSSTSYRLQLRGTNFLDVGNGYVSSYNLGNANNLQIRISSGTTLSNKVFKPMLTLDTSATYDGYEPYNGYTTTINLGGTYYGGTLDAVSGVLTVTDAFVEITASNGEYASYLNRYLIRANVLNLPTAKSSYDECICDEFETKTLPQIEGGAVAVYAHNDIIAICNYKTSLADYQTFLTNNPVHVAYKVATPFTIQLDPQTLETLVGKNDVFAPLVGQTVESVEYREVLAIDDVPKAIPYESVDPIQVDWFTIFKIHRYGRVVVLKFDDISASPVVSEDGWAILGRLPERFYHKYPNQMVAENMIFGVINNDNGTLQMKKLIIDQYNGDVKIYFLANEQINPLGSITYILDHD